MDSRQEILDAIQILIDGAMNNVTQIQNGTCTGVALKTCTMLINGRELDNIQFYGNAPIINKQYRVFVPNGNMNIAFIITGVSNYDNKGADSNGKSSTQLNPYPIGSYYWSSVSTNPKDLFGGEWEQIKDKFVLAAGSTYSAGKTGGEATHTLTTNEMPSHAHGLFRQQWYSGEAKVNTSILSWESNTENGAASDGVQSSTDKAGGGAAHNNMPPYIVAYCWHRIG